MSARAPGGRPTLARLRAGVWLPPLVALGIVAGGWQLYAAGHPLVLPTVPAVFAELGHQPGLFAHDAAQTLVELGVGAGSGFAAALLCAIGMSEVRVLERAVMPLAVALNVTPIVSIAPVLTVIFGLSVIPRYLVTALVVFFPVLVNALVGLRSADPAVLDLARTLDAGRLEVLGRIRLPAALPFFFAAARVGVPLGLVGAVVAEFSVSTYAGSGGLGNLIWTAAASGNGLPEVFASILLLAVIGIVLTLAVVLLERRVLAWHAAAPRAR